MQDTNGPETSDPKMKYIPQMKHALHRYAIGVKCSSTDNIIDSSASGRLLEIFPRGNNKMLLLFFHFRNYCLYFCAIIAMTLTMRFRRKLICMCRNVNTKS